MKIKDLYMRYFFLVIIGLCVIAFMIFLYSNRWDPFLAFQDLAKNFGTGVVGSVLSLIVIRTQFERFFDDVSLKNSGIRGYRNGYPEILGSLGGVDKFFSLRLNKTIDIFGIAMAEFFDTNSIVELLYKKAKNGYTVRVFFADPNSEELKNQEITEKKPGELQLSIKRLTRELKNRFSNDKSIKDKISIYHLRSMPRAFILKAGNRMIVTNYLYEGPTQAPSIFLKDDEYLNAFEKYMDYINDSAKSLNSKEVNISSDDYYAA